MQTKEPGVRSHRKNKVTLFQFLGFMYQDIFIIIIISEQTQQIQHVVFIKPKQIQNWKVVCKNPEDVEPPSAAELQEVVVWRTFSVSQKVEEFDPLCFPSWL